MVRSACFLAFSCIISVAAGAADTYGIIVDAGSSGSRLRMFKWDSMARVASVEGVSPSSADESLFEVEPGLSSYGGNPAGAGASLKAMVQAAKKYIPAGKHSTTQFFVKATAGMRLLDSATAHTIFQAVGTALKPGGAANSTFKFVSAAIISGEEEGVFGYASANSILKTLGKTSTFGALDLGGASTQVTFKPTKHIREGEFSFYTGGIRQSVYAHSYITYGQDQAVLRVLGLLVKSAPNNATIKNPCYNKGYSKTATVSGSSKNPVNFTGSGDVAACSALAKQLLHLDYECPMANCAIAGTHMTALSGSFRAFSAFFFTANGVGLLGWNDEKKLSRKQVKDAGATFCGKPWSEVGSKYGANYCFASQYISLVLEAYGFPETDATSVTYSRKIAGVSLDWTLGAMLYEAKMMPLSKSDMCPLEVGTAPSGWQYTIVVDAGSSGSRLRMYKWNLQMSGMGLQGVSPSSNDEAGFETEPGLSSYSGNPAGAGASLKGLLQAAKKYIPVEKHSSTMVFIMATAGMRLLDSATAHAIFQDVSSALAKGGAANSTFKFVSAEIISGEEEGVFGYASANSILKTLGTSSTSGALDLGGASTQVTFRPTKHIRDGEFSLYTNASWKAARESLYTHSYITYGQDQAVLRVFGLLVKANPNNATIKNPCYNKGYSKTATVTGSTKNPVNFTGTGDAAGCSALAKTLLHLDYECSMPNCAIAGTHMTALAGTFRAFSAFFFTANGVGLLGWNDEKKLSRKQIKDAGTTFCGKAWSEVGSKYGANYCFASQYISHVLEAYGFAETDANSVTYSRKIAGVSLDWTLGAVLYKTGLMQLDLKNTGLCPSGSQQSTSRKATTYHSKSSTKSPKSITSTVQPGEQTSSSAFAGESTASLGMFLVIAMAVANVQCLRF